MQGGIASLKPGLATHQLPVAEEVDPRGVDGLAVLGPRERGHWVALHRRRDPQLLPLVHGHVAQRTAASSAGLERLDWNLQEYSFSFLLKYEM